MTHIWLRKAKVKKRAMTHNSRIGQNLKNPDPLQERLFNKNTICEKKFQKIHSSAPNQGPKIIDFELSNKQNYVNLRGWNPNLRAMGLI